MRYPLWASGCVVLAVTCLMVLALSSPPILGIGLAAGFESKVSVGSPATPFPQSNQTEPSVAIDQTNPSRLVAAANDEIDKLPCTVLGCPPTASFYEDGVGISGVYFSFDGGAHWTQPTYQGFTGRSGALGAGPIGTLPHYYESGLMSFGDPVVAFGPKPAAGGFSWANGARLYYSNLALPFPGNSPIKGPPGFVGAVAVSYTDELAAAAAGDPSAWSSPLIVDIVQRSSTTFGDKPTLWADNAVSSPFFGNVYVCYTNFTGQETTSNQPNALFVTRSTDGGGHFSRPQRLTSSSPIDDNAISREACILRTDSTGTVYLMWEDHQSKQNVFVLARSFDGGTSFSEPVPVTAVTDVGADDGIGQITFDGVTGARTYSWPYLDIANGSPTGLGAPNTMVLAWSDGSAGLGHEQALVMLSPDRGNSWTTPQAVQQAGDRPDFTRVAISPDGRDIYFTYQAFLQPFQTTNAVPRLFQNVVLHGNLSGATASNVTTLFRAAVGDSRASTRLSQKSAYLGDYNWIAATNAGAVAFYTDARNAAVCDAVDVYRDSLLAGSPIPVPVVVTDCPGTFGNLDIYSVVVPKP